MGLIWPIEIGFGLQFMRVECVGRSVGRAAWLDARLCLFWLKFPRKKKINRNGTKREEKKSPFGPSFMREWTRPFVIQPNYVKSKTVYLLALQSIDILYSTASLCRLPPPSPSPHGQSKLFCINLCFRFSSSGDGGTLIEFRNGNHFIFLSVCLSVLGPLHPGTVFMCVFRYQSPFFIYPPTSNVRTANTIRPILALTIGHSFILCILDLFKLYLFYVASVSFFPPSSSSLSSSSASFWLTSTEIGIFPY